ncbi:uncharacterized protein LOC117784034 [Drosophila innubila]|uniref:uncharacterized protein LOC117784034 n=1 Tax=Drosophila innubila TaxID=198719 RepID=UPI00148E605B|nr:uncharacterized protein LOC117784034 [Drosophila innubila]
MFSKCLTKLDAQLHFTNIYCSRRYIHHRDSAKAEQISKINKRKRISEPNPEYHHAPSSYVENYLKHHLRSQTAQPTMFHRNPRYRWIDFRRRMVYGTHDI